MSQIKTLAGHKNSPFFRMQNPQKDLFGHDFIMLRKDFTIKEKNLKELININSPFTSQHY